MEVVNEVVAPYWQIFEKPIVDDSTTKYEFKEIRETNVNVSKLDNFEFTIKDLESWILPSDSYLHAKIKIPREDGKNMDAVDKATLTNNGFNLFKNAEYIINGKTIESIDYVGISTTVKNLLEFSDDYSRSAATNMFWYKDKTQTNDSFTEESEFVSTSTTAKAGESPTIKTKKNDKFNSGLLKRYNKTKESHVVSMYLPLSRLFGFCQDINRVFRGVTHKIALKRNSNNNMIIKKGSQNFKVDIMYLSWILPVLNPSLFIRNELEGKLVKKSSFELRWEACNTYKSDNRNDKELTWRVVSERCNTTKIVVVLQKTEKNSNALQNNMVFDHMNIEKIEVRVNGYKYPQEELKCDFSNDNEDYSNAYQRFLHLGYKHRNVDSGTIVSYNDFKTVYPLFCFDVSKHEPNIYASGSNVDIEIKLLLDQEPADSYNIYCVIFSERKANMDVIDHKLYVNL